MGTALLIGLLATTAKANATPAWEKLYTWTAKTGKAGAPQALWADESGWLAAGPGLLVAGGAAGVEELARPRYRPVAFSGPARAELYLVGWNQLILKLDGKQWIEEHFVAGDTHSGRKGDDLLERVATLPIDGKPMPVATGPWLVMVRHPDGTWQELPEEPRQRVLGLAHDGPAGARPAGCAPGRWSWTGKDRALFSCRDGRAFLLEGGKTQALPRLPKACQRFERARVRGQDAYLLCAGQLWQSSEDRWRRVDTPPKPRDFAVTDRCLYAASGPAVWRRCQP